MNPIQKYPHIIELYTFIYLINICCDIFISYKFFGIRLECIQFQSYQSMLHDYYPHTKLSNEFL